jgi:hypothetical protein
MNFDSMLERCPYGKLGLLIKNLDWFKSPEKSDVDIMSLGANPPL